MNFFPTFSASLDHKIYSTITLKKERFSSIILSFEECHTEEKLLIPESSSARSISGGR